VPKVSGSSFTIKGALSLRKVPLTPLDLGGSGGGSGAGGATLTLSIAVSPATTADASGTRQALLQGPAAPYALMHGAGTSAFAGRGQGLAFRRAPQLARDRKDKESLAVPSDYVFSLVTAGSISLGERLNAPTGHAR
jgi:hypothetical protein